MERCLFPARVGIFSFLVKVIKVPFPICTLTWGVNNYVSRQGRGIHRRNQNTNIVIIIICIVETLFLFCNSIQLTVVDWKSLKGKPHFVFIKNFFELNSNSIFTTVELFASSESMATLKNKRKLAAVSRIAQEISRNSQTQTTSVPGITEDYIM